MSDNTLLPNTTQIPNVILDHWLPHLTGSELRVVLYVCRRTYGFNKQEDRISLKQMAEGIRKRDGTVLDQGAGLSKSAAAEACKSLEQKRVLVRRQTQRAGGGDAATAYALDLQRRPGGGVQKSDTGCPETGQGGVQKQDTQNPVLQNQGSSKETNVSLSGDGQKAAPMEMGAYGISELMQRVSEARQRGSQIDSPTNSERKDYGAQFRQCAKDGVDVDLLLTALDYMVAKASGAIESEAKAWCGFRTALDRVREGWRAPRHLRAVSNPEADDERDREWAEIEAMTAEILRGVV